MSAKLEKKQVVYENLQIPIVWEGDVLVAGGGPGGLGAAIAAHRLEKKTMILEALGFLGGMASYGAGMPLGGAYPGLKTIGGIAEEILTIVRTSELDAADVRHVEYFGDWYYHNSEYFKSLIAKFIFDEKIPVRLHTFVSDVIMDTSRTVLGVIAVNKSGYQAYLAKTIIDATGDADVCTRAGADFEAGDENGAFMAMTIPYNIGGCNVKRFVEYRKTDPCLENAKTKARSMGINLTDDDRFVAVDPGVKQDWIFSNMVRIRNCDGTKVEDLTRAEIEARIRILNHLKMFRAVIPGCENAYIANTAATIGIRDSRRIVGEDYLSTQDCLDLRKKPDTVVLRCAGPFDNATRGNSHLPHNSIDITKYYDIPYGVIVPKKLGNIVVSGRTFSSSALAQSGSRGIALLMGMGQAAGTAASISIDDKVEFKNVNVKKLQQQLINDKCDLGI